MTPPAPSPSPPARAIFTARWRQPHAAPNLPMSDTSMSDTGSFPPPGGANPAATIGSLSHRQPTPTIPQRRHAEPA